MCQASMTCQASRTCLVPSSLGDHSVRKAGQVFYVAFIHGDQLSRTLVTNNNALPPRLPSPPGHARSTAVAWPSPPLPSFCQCLAPHSVHSPPAPPPPLLYCCEVPHLSLHMQVASFSCAMCTNNLHVENSPRAPAILHDHFLRYSCEYSVLLGLVVGLCAGNLVRESLS